MSKTLYKKLKISQNATPNSTLFQFDIYNMKNMPDGQFHAFVRYTNLSSGEIRLRPLVMDSVHEIADALVDIYCEQGAPVVLQSLNGRDVVEKVVQEVNKIMPQCRQLHGDVRPTHQFHQQAEPDLLQQLMEIKNRYSTNNWSKLLRVLQYELNTSRSGERLGAKQRKTKKTHVKTLETGQKRRFFENFCRK